MDLGESHVKSILYDSSSLIYIYIYVQCCMQEADSETSHLRIISNASIFDFVVGNPIY